VIALRSWHVDSFERRIHSRLDMEPRGREERDGTVSVTDQQLDLGAAKDDPLSAGLNQTPDGCTVDRA
jgi:hypothetical protein